MMSISLNQLFPNTTSLLTACVILVLSIIYIVLSGRGHKKKDRSALDPITFTDFPLITKVSLSHDTHKFTFALPNGPTGVLGLPVGQHITLQFSESVPMATDGDGKGAVETKNHMRSYTPVTGDDTPGTVTFVIKVYKGGVHPKFPEGGKMSQHLDSLKIGDTVAMRGPKGHMTYHKNGNFTVFPILKKDPTQQRTAKRFGMIAGGTGITPMLQIMNAVLRDEPHSSITVSLLYANQSEEDILVRDELELALSKYGGRFTLHYTLDRPPSTEWKYSTGFITKEMLRDHLPGPSDDGSTQILMCGPPPMVKFACVPNLEALGFKKADYYVF